MFRGGGQAGGGKRGKKSLEFVKQTPKFLMKMREEIVLQENSQINEKLAMLEQKKSLKQDNDLENATIINFEDKNEMIISRKNQDNEIKTQEIDKNFKPCFVSKNNKLIEKKGENPSNGKESPKNSKPNNDVINEKKDKNLLGKRKPLDDIVGKYLKDDLKKKQDNIKKAKHNLLSFEE